MEGYFPISRTVVVWVPITTTDKLGAELSEILESETQASTDMLSAEDGFAGTVVEVRR